MLERGRQTRILFSVAAFFSLSLSVSVYLSIYLSFALSLLRVLDRRISTRQRSYSPLESTSSRRAFVAPSSFILASSSERSETETRRTLLSRTLDPVSSTIFTVGGAQFFFFHLSFLPFSPSQWTTQSRSPFFFSPLAPSFLRFSLLSLSLVISASDISPVLLLFPLLPFISFFLHNFLYSLSFDLAFFTLSLSFSLFLSLPVFSVLFLLLYLHSSRKGQARISFSFLLLQH